MLSYEQYRTGLTFRDVFHILDAEARHKFERYGVRMFITRRTVLGRWRQIKLTSYEGYRRAEGGKNEAA